MKVIETRKLQVINIDPQHRCYDGVNAKEEMVWTQLESVHDEQVERRLRFWQELNDYAINARGNSAKCEFRTKHD
jgi:hypothetical protein